MTTRTEIITPHLKKIKRFVKRSICSRSGKFARFIRNPNPLASPCRASELNLVRPKGLGDVLLCTPALRQLKVFNPSCHVRFFTDFSPLVEGLPYIDEVHPTGLAPTGAIHLGYEGNTPPQAHLARIIGDQLGLDVTDIKPDCVRDPGLVQEYVDSLRALPKPHVVVLRRASRWTPNKDWPSDYWDVVVEEISRMGTAIEVGDCSVATSLPSGSYLDFRGNTTVTQLSAVIEAADLYVGPVSGPMHLAAAVGTRAVVIYGGYESPVGYEGYENLGGAGLTQISLYSPVSCAPCWRTDECPYGRKCLSLIEPSEVIASVEALLEKCQPAPLAALGR